MTVNLTKAQRQSVEELACRLYDEANPQPQTVVNKGKQACIDEARRRLFPLQINRGR